MELNHALPTRIVSILRGQVDPLLLLGAGASVKSGIPLASEMVERVAHWGYCNEHGLHQSDPHVMRTDWFRWLTKHPWYDIKLPPEDNYPAVIEKILQPKLERKKFFLENILGNRVEPSRGYEDVCNLIARRLITTVLTTNFDDVLQRQSAKHPPIQRLEVIQTPADYTNLSTSPSWPQLVYLHGSVEHYTDQNTIDETEELNRDLIERLVPLLRDHPLIVVGYRGAESSVMKRLLGENAKKCDGFRHGIFWCIRGVVEAAAIHKNVLDLAHRLGPNFHVISMGGFDELLEDIWAHVESTRLPLDDLASRYPDAAPSPSFDLSAVSGTDVAALDESLLRPTLVGFCESSGISVPSELDGIWLTECARIANVIDKVTSQCTVAGCLLFARKADSFLPSAVVVVRFSGESTWLARIVRALEGSSEEGATSFEAKIVGNLWQQLDRLTEILGAINRPFRLKGTLAEDVFPYAPIALREFLTNMLVHRDYSNRSPSTVSIAPDSIRFENSGGLVPRMQSDTHGESLQAVLEKGLRGLKGYRNPAISEFFLVTRRMEKEGSGLPDVLEEAAGHNNAVFFGPSADNTTFSAEIKIRPDQFDPVTDTARPERTGSSVLGNILEIVSWPRTLWKAGVTVSFRTLAKELKGQPIPPCFIFKNWLWSFSPQIGNQDVLKPFLVEEEIYEVATDVLLQDTTLSRGISQMLADAISAYIASLGLIPRRERDGTVRAYFPKEEEGARSVTYRGRFREATRMVAKPIVSRTSGQISFWEHKAVSIKPERAGDVWFITLLPTYVFTLNGVDRPIERERIGAMSTRRASRDYNPSVRHDLAFWIWVLSRGAEEVFKIPLAEPALEAKAATVSAVLPLIATRAMEDVPDDMTIYEGMSAEEIEIFEQEIEKLVESEEANASTDPNQ